ncbi:MAG: hypothetical protein ACPF8V_00605 [Luteibaculum sp.]
MSAFQELLQSLNRFIRKYHLNQIIRGCTYLLASGLGFFLIINTLEYFGAFSSKGRTALLFGYLAVNLWIAGRFILWPLLQLFQIRRGLSNKQAALLLGKHFPVIADKLINVLELKELSDNNPEEIRSLIEAGIDQKAEEIKPVPILSAVNFKENLVYLRYALPSLAIIILALIFVPEFITESSKRILAYDQEFVPQAPFNLEINQRKYILAKGENFDFELRVQSGLARPNYVRAIFGEYFESFTKVNNETYQLKIKNVQSDFSFEIEADGFYFGNIEVEVRPVPLISDFILKMDVPAYTELENKEITGTGDAVVPLGTKLTWIIRTEHTEKLGLIPDSLGFSPKNKGEEFNFSKTALADFNYGVLRQNEFSEIIDSGIYSIKVIPDLHPVIQVIGKTDSLAAKSLLILGEASDDYGLGSLSLYTGKKGEPKAQMSPTNIPFNRAARNADFSFLADLISLGFKPGDEVQYFVRVTDNDAINGPKSTDTEMQSINIKSAEELRKSQDESISKGTQNLEKLTKDSENFEKSIDDVKKQILNKPSLDLNDKKSINNLMKQKEQMDKKLEELRDEFDKTKELQKNNPDRSENLKEKQDQLEEVLDNMQDEEMQKLLQELQEIMKNMDQESLMQKMKEIEESTENFNKEIERSLELLKKFALELKLEDSANKIEELAKKQEELAERQDDSPAEQKSLNEEFAKEKEKLDALEKEAKELEQELGLEQSKKAAEELQKEMQKTLEELQKNSGSNKSNQQQQKNASDMKKMAQQMKQSLSAGDQAQNAENIEDLKQILENLMTLSSDQEGLYESFGSTGTQDPRYNKFSQDQVNLSQDFKIVEDSLNALAKRVAQIQNVVYQHVSEVKYNMDEAKSHLAERMTAKAQVHQRYALTSINNLALLLDEILRQLEQQQAQAKPGMANCNKPKPGQSNNPSMQQLRQAQEQMAKKMEEMMKKSASEGKKKGDEKKDGKGSSKGESHSKELVEMAAKQAEIRKKLREMAKELNKDGSGAGNKLNELAEDLEKAEEDIYNDRINPQSIMRQQEIITKMLEEENAERTQELDKQRKGDRDFDLKRSNPLWEDYLKRRAEQIEQYQTLPPKLKEYYREKSSKYLNSKE